MRQAILMTGLLGLSVFANPLPSSMGALGDSITAAAFGNWRRTDALFPWNQNLFFDQLIAYKLLGDDPRSIERRSKSWATGSDRSNEVISHARRLAFLNREEKFRSYNASVTGALARELKYQLPRLMQWSEQKLGKSAPDYVTILIGGNDICASNMTPTGRFTEDVASIVDTLLVESPDTKILLSSIPQLDRLATVVGSAPWARSGRLKTCRDLLSLTRLCHNVTLETDPAKIEEIALRVREYHDALHQIVDERRPLYGDRIRFGSSPFDQGFSEDDMSIDCFHPGVSGQARLAEHLFQESWWSADWDRVKGEFGRHSKLLELEK